MYSWLYMDSSELELPRRDTVFLEEVAEWLGDHASMQRRVYPTHQVVPGGVETRLSPCLR